MTIKRRRVSTLRGTFFARVEMDISVTMEATGHFAKVDIHVILFHKYQTQLVLTSSLSSNFDEFKTLTIPMLFVHRLDCLSAHDLFYKKFYYN